MYPIRSITVNAGKSRSILAVVFGSTAITNIQPIKPQAERTVSNDRADSTPGLNVVHIARRLWDEDTKGGYREPPWVVPYTRTRRPKAGHHPAHPPGTGHCTTISCTARLSDLRGHRPTVAASTPLRNSRSHETIQGRRGHQAGNHSTKSAWVASLATFRGP